MEDHTELPAQFDFDLHIMPDATLFGGGAPLPQGDGPAPPDLPIALEEQPGLQLRAFNGPVEVLIIDHMERPSAN